MTELTEHAKSVLRAIADEKQVEQRNNDGVWCSVDTLMVFNALMHVDGWRHLRIKPETRSINGKEFAAPITGDGFDLNISTGASYLDNRCFVFARSEDRDTAYQAIVDALEGKSK